LEKGAGKLQIHNHHPGKRKYAEASIILFYFVLFYFCCGCYFRARRWHSIQSTNGSGTSVKRPRLSFTWIALNDLGSRCCRTMMMMMSISPFGHKAVGDLFKGQRDVYSHQSHSPIIEASDSCRTIGRPYSQYA
jgi:hypothetical protein